jgi:hypothetical protein
MPQVASLGKIVIKAKPLKVRVLIAGAHHLLPQLAGVDPAAPPVKGVPGHVSASRDGKTAP